MRNPIWTGVWVNDAGKVEIRMVENNATEVLEISAEHARELADALARAVRGAGAARQATAADEITRTFHTAVDRYGSIASRWPSKMVVTGTAEQIRKFEDDACYEAGCEDLLIQEEE